MRIMVLLLCAALGGCLAGCRYEGGFSGFGQDCQWHGNLALDPAGQYMAIRAADHHFEVPEDAEPAGELVEEALEKLDGLEPLPPEPVPDPE